MAKKTKKTTVVEKTTEQTEKPHSDATETLLTQEPPEGTNAPQNATGEELQKQEPFPVPETVPVPAPSPLSPESQSSLDQTKPKQETLDPEPEDDAALQIGQCPRCKHVNSERGFIFPGLKRVVAPGVYNGVKYQIVETRRTKCEKCGQVFFIKKYL
jgi:hypothetical protein